MLEACFYEHRGDGAVRCGLCPHACVIPEGRCGLCGVRENRAGTLYSLVYGRAIAEHADPIEKKPLFHVLPGSRSYSIATAGCNLGCRHCQNAEIAHLPRTRGVPDTPLRSPEDIIAAARASGCQSIACTYTEPTVFFEYARDIAACAREAGLKTVFVTNGYITPAAIEAIAPFLDAANIDLKAFSDSFYRDVCAARLQPVLEAIRCYRQCGIWIEITTLVIPGLNDGPDELREAAEYIASVGDDIPWHVSAFYPTYRMTERPSTSPAALHMARSIGLSAGLHYVYTGNIAGHGGEDTNCHACGARLIQRRGYSIAANILSNGRCPVCLSACAGVFEEHKPMP